MTDFVLDNTDFANQPKTDLNPIGANDPLKWIQGVDWQEVLQACKDLRNYALHRLVHGGIFRSNGMDGVHHFDGVTTILGVPPATVDGVANTYHFTRDLHLDDGCIIDAGVRIWVENCRFLWRGTLTNNGHVHNDGRPGIGRASGSNSNSRTYAAGNGSGGNGSNGPGAGTAGTATTSVSDTWSSQVTTAAGAAGADKGQGGGGGSAGANAGGGGGAVTVIGLSPRLDILALFMGRTSSGFAAYGHGSGGGGGAVVGGSTGQGGGGGAGGCWLFAGGDILAGTGSITCKGGKGADAVLGDSVGAGGGASGGGGILGLMYTTNIGPNTFSASGGTAGVGHGTGANGGVGSAGDVVDFNLSNDGT